MEQTVAGMLEQEEVPAIKVNAKGFIIDMNRAFEETYGYGRREFIGRPLSVIIPKNLQASHHIGFSRFLNTEKATLMNQSLKLSIQHANGQVMTADHFIVAEKINQEWVFAATIKLIEG